MYIYILWTVLGHRMSDEEVLLHELFQDYNPSARPVINSSQTVPVSIEFSLLQIQELVRQIGTYYTHIKNKTWYGRHNYVHTCTHTQYIIYCMKYANFFQNSGEGFCT